MNVNARDFGLVVGINNYAGLRHLKWAAQDAAAFTSWLCEPSGGGLPRENVRTLIGSRDPQRPNDPYYPTLEQIDKAIIDFVKVCGEQQGRRLYFYFAGHGIGTSPTDVAMLLANAQPGYLNNNLGLQVCCNQLHDSACFTELIFFLDCCREFNEHIMTRGLALSLPRDEQRAPSVRRLVIYAAGYGARAFEPASVNRDGRGLLTQALLEGLTGRAAKQGQVTANGLYRYIQSRIPKLAAVHNLEQQPRGDISHPDFIICQVGRRQRWIQPSQPADLPQASATEVSSAEPAWEDLLATLLRLTRKLKDSDNGAPQQVTLLENLSDQHTIAVLAAEAGLTLTVTERQIEELQRGVVPRLNRSAANEYVPIVTALVARAGKYSAGNLASAGSAEHIGLARDAVINALATARLLGERAIRWKLEDALRRAALVLDTRDDAMLVLDETGHIIAEHVPGHPLAGPIKEWKLIYSSATNGFSGVHPVNSSRPDLYSVRTLLVYLQPRHLLIQIVCFHQANEVVQLDLINNLRLAAEQAAQHAAVTAGGRTHLSTLSDISNTLLALCNRIEHEDAGAAMPETSGPLEPLSKEVMITSGLTMRSQYDRLDRWLANIGLDGDFRALIRILLPTVQERSRMPLSADTITRATFLAHIDDLGRLDDLEDLLIARFPDKRPV